MTLDIRSNLYLSSSASRPFAVDAYFLPDGIPKPIVIFAHGFKGFKDWGHWHELAKSFAQAGYFFLKFNFSHNGVSLEHPTEFVDLEAFGQNNYSKEWADLDTLLSALHTGTLHLPAQEMDLARTCLIGHSRGGGLSIVKTAQDERIHGLVTWASVDSLAYAWKTPGFIEKWKQDGKYVVVNGRTGQEMPLYYQFFEDFQQHMDKFSIEQQLRNLRKPMLIIHGTADPAVPVEAAQHLHSWKTDSVLRLIEGADHVFGGRHPFPAGEKLPPHASQLLNHTITFLRENL
jgi:pimeloyl-ACP methyl ester carboxylesterase